MNIDHSVRNSIYRTGRIALRLRLNRARLTFTPYSPRLTVALLLAACGSTKVVSNQYLINIVV
jgi:hypothetical protein